MPRPATATFALLRDAVRLRAGRLALGLLLLVLTLNSLETAVDGRITRALGVDFADTLRRVEGEVVPWLQRTFGTAPADRVWAWLYLFAYPPLMILPAVAAHRRGDSRAVQDYLGAAGVNYLVAIPFYLFVPVTETGFTGYADSWPGVDAAWPRLAPLLRAASGVDNCFPSLHASFSFTAALFVWRAEPRRAGWVAWLAAACIVASTWTLAVHWLLDSVAGLVLALAAWRGGPPLAAWCVARWLPEAEPTSGRVA